MNIRSRCRWRKRRWRRDNISKYDVRKLLEQRGQCYSFHTMLKNILDNHVLIVLTAGGDFGAVTGILGAVHCDHITLVNGKVITSIPIERIAAVSHLAGGGPIAPLKTWLS